MAQRLSLSEEAGSNGEALDFSGGDGTRRQVTQECDHRGLLLIDSIVDQASATMRLKAIFDNEDEQLWPGDFVNARLLVELRHDVLTVPPAAVQRGPDGIYAWVVMPGDVVQARPIQSGPTTGDDTIITSGLSEGERIVINGQYKLQQNSKVTVNEGAAPATPTAAKRDRAS